MRRTLFATASLMLLLAACAGAGSVAFRLTYDTQDAARKTELSQAVERVMERRLLGLKQSVKSEDIHMNADRTSVTVKTAGKQVADALRAQVAEPFSMRIMLQAESGAIADVSNPKYGAFNETDLTEKDFDWIKAGQSGITKGKGAVLITFTDAGKQKLRKIFSTQQGKIIGIFVRGLMMSRKMISDKDTQDSILVDGVPTLELAGVFADDVNTGLHVKFEPIQ